jgi:SNF2 family DNA or RNA helicase
MYVELYDSDTIDGWIDCPFKYDEELVNIFRKQPKRTYDGARRIWSIPKDGVSHLMADCKKASIDVIDKRGNGEKANHNMAVTIRNDGFITNFGEVKVRPEMSRMYYLKRPRDGYRVAEILNAEGFKVKVKDKVKNNPIKMHPNVQLYPFQEECMQFLRQNDYNGLVALDIGLGKTMVSCKAIEEIGKGPVLVVAPSSLLYQWKEEIESKFSYMNATVVTSKIKAEDRLEAVEEALKSGIMITNYEFLRTIPIKFQVELLILDEAHRVRNWNTKTAKVIGNIPARHVIGLTGTPIVNHLKELYHITDQIKPGFFGTMKSFYGKYVNKDGYRSTYKDLEGVYERLNDLMYRKRKQDVLMQLPKRITQTIYVQLTKQERDFYEDMLASQPHILAAISNAKVFGVSSTLRIEKLDMSSKEKELMTVLNELHGQIILFCESKTEVKRLGEMDLKRESFVLHGDSNKEQRETVRKKFRDSSDGILLMTEIGTEGLNLQYAGNLINFSIPWTYSALEQRIGRIERLGSDFDTVNVVNMLTDNTIDNHVADVVADKAHLFNMTVDGAKQEVSRKFASDLFSMGIKVNSDGSLSRVKEKVKA